MGQLWEGLYKNYLLPIVTRNKPTDTYVPIILLNKNHNHLLVLYEANHEKKKLIQKKSPQVNSLLTIILSSDCTIHEWIHVLSQADMLF